MQTTCTPKTMTKADLDLRSSGRTYNLVTSQTVDSRLVIMSGVSGAELDASSSCGAGLRGAPAWYPMTGGCRYPGPPQCGLGSVPAPAYSESALPC